MKTLIAILITVTLIGCGTEKGNKGKDNSSDTLPSGYFAKFKDNGKTIAYIIDFYRGYATAYLKTAKLYVTIDPDTGAYLQLPDARDGRVYFPNSDCTGTGVMEGFEGQVGKTVLALTDGKYYLASERSDYRGATFAYASYLNWSGVCQSSSSTLYFIYSTVNLIETTQPYDFSAVANLEIEYK